MLMEKIAPVDTHNFTFSKKSTTQECSTFSPKGTEKKKKFLPTVLTFAYL